MDLKHEISTQTDSFDDTALVLSQPDADILYSYYQKALNPAFHQIDLFDQTVDVFNRVKYESHNAVELRLCVKIGLIFIDALKHKPGYNKILRHTYAMIETLLPQLSATHDASERTILEEYIRIHDLAITGQKNAEHLKPLAHIIEITGQPTAARTDNKSTQTLHTQADLVLAVPHHGLTGVTHEDLAFRFGHLQTMTGLSKNRSLKEKKLLSRHWFNMQQDAWVLFKQLTRENRPADGHPLGSPLMDAIFLSLNIQLNYITFLDALDAATQNPARNLQKISKALQLMAQQLRMFNAYYQRSDAGQAQKQEMRCYSDYIQAKSIDAKELSTYKKILTCTCLTRDEKGHVSEKYQLLQALQVKHVDELFKSFYRLREESQPVISEDATIPALRDACTRALKNNANSDVFRSLLKCAIHRLNLEFNEVMSLADDYQVAVYYIDGDILRQDITYMPEDKIRSFYDGAGANKLKLLIILDLYYKIKIAYLEAYIPSISPTENGYIEFEKHQLFSSHFRRDAIRFLLLDDSNYTVESVMRNTTDLAFNVDLSTPFIRDLAHYKLQQLSRSEKIARGDEMPDSSPDQATISAAPQKSQPKKKAHAKKHSSKSKAHAKKSPSQPNLDMPSSAVDTLESLIKQFGSMHLLQPAPGWACCRAQVKHLLAEKNTDPAKLDQAWELINQWMYDALQDEEAESTPFKRSIFEAIFFMALIEKSRQHYDNALSMLHILKNYRVPSCYETTYFEQTQQILCEEALIYQLKNQPENAERCFAEASSRAEERGVVCFPSAYHQATHARSKEHLDRAAYYTRYLEQLAPMAIDDYSLPYLHKFYHMLLQQQVLMGISGTFQLIAGERTTVTSTSNPNAQAVHVIGLLLNTRFDERSIDTKMVLLLLDAQAKATLHFDSYTKQSRDAVQEAIKTLRQHELTDDVNAELMQLEGMMELTNNQSKRFNMKKGRTNGIQRLAGGSHPEEFVRAFTHAFFPAGVGQTSDESEENVLSAIAQLMRR